MSSTASSSQTIAAPGGQAKIHPQKSGPLYTGDVNDSSFTEFMAIVCSFIFFVLTFPITIFSAVKVIQEYERAVIFRMGRIKKGKAAGPGAFFILPCTDEFKKVDLRTITFDVPPQEVLTKDSVTVAVDAIVFYRIFDPTMAVVNVSNVDYSTKLLSASILRNILGTKKLQEIMSDREGVSTMMRVALDEATDPWGVRVERVEIKDYRLPPQMIRVMASEAEASREAKAKLIAAEAEITASKALKGASDALSSSSGAIQLRYMQTLSKLGQGQPTIIYFPLPLNMLQK